MVHSSCKRSIRSHRLVLIKRDRNVREKNHLNLRLGLLFNPVLSDRCRFQVCNSFFQTFSPSLLLCSLKQTCGSNGRKFLFKKNYVTNSNKTGKIRKLESERSINYIRINIFCCPLSQGPWHLKALLSQSLSLAFDHNCISFQTSIHQKCILQLINC